MSNHTQMADLDLLLEAASCGVNVVDAGIDEREMLPEPQEFIISDSKCD